MTATTTPTETREQHLVDHLSDVYSIEQQALAQLRTAPDIAGEPRLAEALRQHLAETERQAERVRERLEAHGGSPGRVKDAVMRLGGKGFLLFARVQPDTPGKLAAHTHSYEALEEAAYGMLLRSARRAGDEATADLARTIRGEESAMRQRIAGTFEAVADASLADKEGEEIEDALRIYLADAHALEAQAIQLLEKGTEIGGAAELRRIYAGHLVESRTHAQRVEERLEALGGDPSTVKDTALRAAALNWGLFFQAQSDTPAKLAVFAYAFEHLEIAGYELLKRVAARAGDSETVALCDVILAEERAMAERVAAAFDDAFAASLAEEGDAAG